MSLDVLLRVLKRVSHEPDFRHQLMLDPEACLHDYDLTPEERAALLGSEWLAPEPMALDTRRSKTFIGGELWYG